jgi:ATP-dependent protease HslVU (ClpYQ) peptidase subunit
MSVAVAVRTGRSLALATDSMIHFGGEKVPTWNLADPKMRRVGNAWLAATGWTLYSNILDDWLGGRKRAPSLANAGAVFRFFNDLWGRLHDRYSFVKDQPDDHDSPFGDLDSTFLVISPGGLFHVASDLSVTTFERYFAIGSGAPTAMGAVHALASADPEADASVLARAGVEAALTHDLYCGGPVNLQTVRARG